MSTKLEITLRPLKFALIVNPYDQKSILEAIQLNSFLWGGTYNPIIPKFNKIPKNWEHPRTKSQTASSIFAGYIDNFDPDFLVPIRLDEFDKSSFANRKIVSLNEIISGASSTGIPSMGVGLFEILRSFIRTELKYIRKDPLHFRIPEHNGKYKLFFASVFGTLALDQSDFFHKHFDKELNAEWSECDFSNFVTFFKGDNVFLRRLTNHQLKVNRHNG
jgi:hypothetical protein